MGLCVKVRPGALYLARQVVLEAWPCALNLVIGSDQIIGGLQAQVVEMSFSSLVPSWVFPGPSPASFPPTTFGWALWSPIVSTLLPHVDPGLFSPGLVTPICMEIPALNCGQYFWQQPLGLLVLISFCFRSLLEVIRAQRGLSSPPSFWVFSFGCVYALHQTVSLSQPTFPSLIFLQAWVGSKHSFC